MNTNIGRKTKDAEAVLLNSLGATPNFGEMLQALRTCDGLTQVALSKLPKTSRQDILDIECGRKLVSPERAAKIAKALGYSPEQFIAQAFQDQIDRGNLKFKVRVEAA